MKALVLSGDSGTRLRPFTYSMAKQLVPVANTPVLVHCLENLREIGVREVGLVVDDRIDDIRALIGDGDELGLEITYIGRHEPLGLAHAVRIAADFLADDDFVLYVGDSVLADGIAGSARTFRSGDADAQVVVHRVDDPGEYGVAEVDADGRVLALAEKPLFPRSDLALVGVCFFTAAVHEAVRSIQPNPHHELEISDALQWLVDRGYTVTADVYEGYWKHTGGVDELLECNRALLGRLAPGLDGWIDPSTTVGDGVVVHDGAAVIGSELVGPLVIGPGAVVCHSVVGPFASIGPGCLVERSTISDSILLDGARVTDARDLCGSLIGRWAEVGPRGDADAGRMIIGDHARAQVMT